MTKYRHILLFTIDCGRTDHILGPEAQTPNLDRFREDGISFDQAFCQANVTIPSLFSLLTSNYVASHGIYSNAQYYNLPPHSLLNILRDNNWNTAAFSGIHFVHYTLGQEFNNQTPLAQKLYPYMTKLSYHFPITKKFFRSLQLGRWDATDQVNKAIRWLQTNSRKGDCFLWIHFFDDHTPYYAPKDFIQNDLGDVSELESSVSLRDQLLEKNLYSPFAERYFDQVFLDLSYFPSLYKISLKYIDHELGRMFQYLKSAGLYENSLMILTSDHGENLTDHGVYCGHKKLYDTTTHVPLLLKDFDNAQAGLEVNSLVQHIDIVPTLLHRLGLSVPEGCSGKNLWPTITSPKKEVNEHLLCEHRYNYQRSIRSREWQYIQSGIFPSKHGEPMPPEKSAAGDIFLLDEPDTLIDRREQSDSNLIEGHPEIAEDLSRKMERILDKCRKDGHDMHNLPQEIKRQLENLGYF